MDIVFYERDWEIKYGGLFSRANIEKHMYRFCTENGNDIPMQEGKQKIKDGHRWPEMHIYSHILCRPIKRKFQKCTTRFQDAQLNINTPVVQYRDHLTKVGVNNWDVTVNTKFVYLVWERHFTLNIYMSRFTLKITVQQRLIHKMLRWLIKK